MTYEELTKLQRTNIYDPNLLQIRSMDALRQHVSNKGTIPDPTNPFTFLLENNAMITSSAMKEVSIAMRKSYPELANTKEDLYGYLNTTEMNNIYSTPSKAMFNIYLGLNEVRRFGTSVNNYSYIKIPKYSNIEVDGMVFTLLNDVSVYVYNNNTVFAKYDFNKNALGVKTDIILDATIVKTADTKEWVMLTLEVPQIKRYSFKETFFNSVPYQSKIKISNNELFTYIEARSVNAITTNIVNMNITFSEFVYDPNNPTLLVKPVGNIVNIEIPFTYMVSNYVSSYVDINLFTTTGYLVVPINKYLTTDFTFNLVLPTTTDTSIIGIENIPTMVSGSGFTYGGRDEISFIDLKNKIINYSTGDNKLPITKYEVKNRVNQLGLTFKKIEKTLLKHDVLVTKHIGSLGYDLYTNMDTMGSFIDLDMSKVVSDKINLVPGNKLTIEPYQLFNKGVNGLTPMSNSERVTYNALASTDLPAYNLQKVYFNLYKYVLEYDNLLSIRAYDVNTPSVIKYMNTYTTGYLNTPMVIIDRYIVNTGTNYELNFIIQTNASIESLDITKLFGEFYYELATTDKLYFKGIVSRDAFNNFNVKFVLNNDTYIDSKNLMKINTTVGNIPSGLVNIVNKGVFSIYSTDVNITASSNTSTINIAIDTASIIFYREDCTVSLGTYLENLYTDYTVNFTDRKFSKYTSQVFKTYDTDIYETDASGIVSLIGVDTTGDGINNDVTVNKLFSKGETMLDVNGKPIVLHNVGDTILDKFNKPIIDPLVGLTHKIFILLLEDSFLRVNDITTKNYRVDFFLNLTDTITKTIAPINGELLDNTFIKFTPDVIDSSVEIIINDKSVFFPNVISPVVTLYTNSGSLFSLDILTEKKLYTKLQAELSIDNTIGNIEQQLKALLPKSILSVKLSNVTKNDSLNIIKYTPESSRFYINKLLVTNDINERIVKPDVKISIVTI